ncbi:ERB1 protein, partial [Menura novaehollandiae]|nr:ERB1 protein [Menura novaehollandiae]
TAKMPGYSYTDEGDYCNGTALGAETRETKRDITNRGTPKHLPPGYFLICGDRAWQGLPRNPFGGPCYLGKLTMFAPSKHNITTFRVRANSRFHRSLTLGPHCNGNLTLWSTAGRVVGSLFVPHVAAGKALGDITKLACWMQKQLNITSKVLSELSEDVNSLRHALLQNRAAIDFLLLAQGHGCEDFEGMCCLNLSDHSISIHKQLADLRNNMNAIRITTDPLSDWFTSLGLTGWLGTLAREGLRLLVVIVIGLIIFTCLIS